MEGRELKANEFTFELKDAAGKVVETVKNDAAGNVKFSKLEFKKGQEGVHKYTVEEVKGTDATVTYDTMKAKFSQLSLTTLQQADSLQALTIKSSTTKFAHQKHLSSNQKNMLFLKRNST